MVYYFRWLIQGEIIKVKKVLWPNTQRKHVKVKVKKKFVVSQDELTDLHNLSCLLLQNSFFYYLSQ